MTQDLPQGSGGVVPRRGGGVIEDSQLVDDGEMHGGENESGNESESEDEGSLSPELVFSAVHTSAEAYPDPDLEPEPEPQVS